MKTLTSSYLTRTFFFFCCIFRLVFSQSLISLDLIEDFLKASHDARDPSLFKGNVLMAKKVISYMQEMSSLVVRCVHCSSLF